MQMHASSMHCRTLPFSDTHFHIEIEYKEAFFSKLYVYNNSKSPLHNISYYI